MTEYFIDQKKYFYFILLHNIASFCIGLIAMLATGTMLIMYFQHTSGMFKIARYKHKYATIIHIIYYFQTNI